MNYGDQQVTRIRNPRVIFTGKEYNRVYRQCERYGKNHYFLKRNSGSIPGKEIDESQIFDASDLHYIKRLSIN